jgi:pilus assembly protein CpaB
MAFVLALLLAVAATFAVFLYVRGVRDEVTTTGGRVQVIVSKVDIASGTQMDKLIAQGGFTTKGIPSDVLVEGVVSSLAQLRGQVARQSIMAGEQITTRRLGGPGTRGISIEIPAGYQAVTVPMDSSKLVGGAVGGGDHVTVYATFDNRTLTLVPEVQVLKVDGGVTGTSNATGPLVTLALKPIDATKVVLAQEKGSLWFALLPPGQEGVNARSVNTDALK